MSWEHADRAREGKGYVKMEIDGAAVDVIILTEPQVVKKAGFRGQPVVRYYFGVVEGGEVKVLDAGAHTCEEIAKATDKKVPAKVVITRHGVPNDPNTSYSVEKVDGTPADAALIARPEIKAAVAEAMGFGPQAPQQMTDPSTGDVYHDQVDEDTIPF